LNGYKTGALYREERGYKDEHYGHKDHHHVHKDEHHHHIHRDEHHHGHKDEHHHRCSSEYDFRYVLSAAVPVEILITSSSEDISVHFSEEHKQQLKTYVLRVASSFLLRLTYVLNRCTSSLGNVLSQVPWMKFRVVAEPDVSCFATDERLRIFMKKITEITIAIVTKQIREEVTEMISKLVTSILTTMTTRISAVQKVVFEHVEEIFTLKDTVTGCESLREVADKICFGGTESKKPDCAPCHQPDVHNEPVYNPGEKTTHKPNSKLEESPVVSPIIPSQKLPPVIDITKANWIWTNEMTKNRPGKPYSRPFRKVVKTDEPIDRLTIAIAGNNRYTLYVNGLLVGRGDRLNSADSYTVSFEPRKEVVIAVCGSEDTGTSVSGLIAAGKLWNSHHEKAYEKAFVTDCGWKTLSKDKFDTKFHEVGFKDAGWEFATEVRKHGVSEWTTIKDTQIGTEFERWTGKPGLEDAPDAPKAKIVSR
jgi:hypothetical protein